MRAGRDKVAVMQFEDNGSKLLGKVYDGKQHYQLEVIVGENESGYSMKGSLKEANVIQPFELTGFKIDQRRTISTSDDAQFILGHSNKK